MTREIAIERLEDAKIKRKIPKAAVTARETNDALDMAVKMLERLESLESEYKAYHVTLYPTGQDSDYWRGVRYALDVIGGNQT